MCQTHWLFHFVLLPPSISVHSHHFANSFSWSQHTMPSVEIPLCFALNLPVSVKRTTQKQIGHEGETVSLGVKVKFCATVFFYFPRRNLSFSWPLWLKNFNFSLTTLHVGFYFLGAKNWWGIPWFLSLLQPRLF